MTKSSQTDITSLLNAWRRGDDAALDRVMPIIYGDLRRLAASQLRKERPDHTLQPTALVHEAFLRLVRQEARDWRGRAHFFALASTMMRRILVDRARRRGFAKRGGGESLLPLDDIVEPAIEPAPGLLALDEALTRLSALAPEQGRLVELRYFAGLSVEETAEVLGVTSRTVKRRWHTAKLWLYRYLNEGSIDGG